MKNSPWDCPMEKNIYLHQNLFQWSVMCFLCTKIYVSVDILICITKMILPSKILWLFYEHNLICLILLVFIRLETLSINILTFGLLTSLVYQWMMHMTLQAYLCCNSHASLKWLTCIKNIHWEYIYSILLIFKTKECS